MCHLSFCQWARRIIIAFAIVNGCWQGLVAVNVAIQADSTLKVILPHFYATCGFAVLALVVLVFDVWQDSRP
jgi:hypothetical protein